MWKNSNLGCQFKGPRGNCTLRHQEDRIDLVLDAQHIVARSHTWCCQSHVLGKALDRRNVPFLSQELTEKMMLAQCGIPWAESKGHKGRIRADAAWAIVEAQRQAGPRSDLASSCDSKIFVYSSPPVSSELLLRYRCSFHVPCFFNEVTPTCVPGVAGVGLKRQRVFDKIIDVLRRQLLFPKWLPGTPEAIHQLVCGTSCAPCISACLLAFEQPKRLDRVPVEIGRSTPAEPTSRE